MRQVVNELRGEKIDIVPFSEDQHDFVAKALSPAKVREVRFHEVEGVAEVVVPDHQLSLAIGREGQNARLAARLTGWRIDIKSETQILDEETAYAEGDWAEGEWVTDPETGEQTWVPADGSEAMSADDWATAAEEAEADQAVGEEPTEDDSEAVSEELGGGDALPSEETDADGPSEEVDNQEETEIEEEELSN